MTMMPTIAKFADAVPSGRPLGIFAINLDRSPDRWADIERHFGGLAWPLQRIKAVDAKLDPASVLAVRGQSLQFPPNGVAWNDHRNRVFMLTEEACLAGHVLTWRQFLASDFSHALVLEDDAEPQDGFIETVSEILRAGTVADIVKLEGVSSHGGRKAITIQQVANRKLVRSLRPSSGSAGYIVTRRGAEKLLVRVGKTCVPADDFLWNSAFHGCDVAHVSPWLIMQSGTASVIATDKAAKRGRVSAPFGRPLLMPVKRAIERLKLLWVASRGRPWTLLHATVAPWAPDVYNMDDRLAADAKNRKSGHG
jgi:glycosyl transferase family 25